MKKIIFPLLVFFAISCNQISNTETQNNDSDYLLQSTIWFQQSAEMQACYYQTFELAKQALKNNLNEYKGNKKTAVVLDIDETVLDNSPFEVFLIQNGKSYNKELWKQWTDKAEAKALAGAVEFTNYAKELGVEVIYISNRRVNELKTTIDNLKKENFPNAEQEFVLLREDTGDKTDRRNKVSENYEILLFIGDNLTDFSQDFAEREADLGVNKLKENKHLLGIKYIILPNPMYGEWEKTILKQTKEFDGKGKLNFKKKLLNGF